MIDACVLYPTVLRRIVIAAASLDWFTPLWSDRVLEEWAHAAAREGDLAEAGARGDIASLRAQFPDAEIAGGEAREGGLDLPDPGDIHVLAAAIAGRADELLTLNTKDFPVRALGAHGIVRRHPDEFLLEAFHGTPALGREIGKIHAAARAHGIDLGPRALMKRARLPRLGKALEAGR